MKNQKKPQQRKTTAQLYDYYNLCLGLIGNNLGLIGKNLGLGKHWATKRWALTCYSNYYGKRVVVGLFDTKEEAENLLKINVKALERLETELYQDNWGALEAKDEQATILCDILMERISNCRDFFDELKVLKLGKEELIDD